MVQRVVKPWLGVLVVPLLSAGCMLLDADSSNTPLDSIAIAYVKRDINVLTDPTVSVVFVPGGDLYMKELSTAGAPETNITRAMTLGAGDVQGPEPNFAANKILFSMRCGVSSAPDCANDRSWNIWEYDIVSGSLHRIIRSSETANQGDDLDPAYLPDGRIIFASNRQQGTRTSLGYRYVDGERKEFAYNLHVMNADGTGIEQITFSLGHDRNPAVLSDGRVLFSRWDKSAQHSKISLYTVKPDGRAMMPYYGAHSPGGGFLQAREMPDGRLIANVSPLSGTFGGGALMSINIRDFGDISDPAPGAQGEAQRQVTVNQVPLNSNFFGEARYAFPFPLNDNSGRILVSVANKPDAEGRTPRFRVALLDPRDNTLNPIVLPADKKEKGDQRLIALEPVALAPARMPPVLPLSVPASETAADLSTEPLKGIINVKSVYDVDNFGYMGSGVLTDAERETLSFPLLDIPGDPRGAVVDIAKMRDPRFVTAPKRPARFVRLVQAIPMPLEVSPAALSGTAMGPKKLVGYMVVEPDGSVRSRVPTDVPLAITVLDQFGRAFVDHDDWFQVRPGEELVCNGCHAFKRQKPLNTGAGTNGFASSLLRAENGDPIRISANGPARPQFGETMAETRTRVLGRDMLIPMQALHFFDAWSFDDDNNDGITITRAPEFHWHLGDLPDDVPMPMGGVIDYETNIQSIWQRTHKVRDKNKIYINRDLSCPFCHDPTSQDPLADRTLLDMRGTTTGNINAATNRAMSYDQLLRGKIEYDLNSKYPYYSMVDGRVVLKRSEPLVIAGRARASKLVEILTGIDRVTGRDVPLDSNRKVDHSIMLSAKKGKEGEWYPQRLMLYEWIDNGAQYFNNLRDAQGNYRASSNRLSPSAFLSTQARRVLNDRCARCHRLFTNGELNRGFQASQFVLTGNFDDDYLTASSMVDDLANPENSKLLRFPTSVSPLHPGESRVVNGVTTEIPQFDLNNIFDLEEYQHLLNWAQLGSN